MTRIIGAAGVAVPDESEPKIIAKALGFCVMLKA